MIPATAAPDVQEAFRDLDPSLRTLLGARNIDLSGRRIINAGQSVNVADYVTKEELSDFLTSPTSLSVVSYLAGSGITLAFINGVLTITNAGVRTLTGTANQVVASASTGPVTLSLPQSIATTSTPQFARLGLGAAADGSAPLSVAGKLLADSNGKVTKFNNVTSAGLGVPAIYAAGRSTAQTAAVASVSTYTVGAADGTFLVSANVLVTTATAHTFGVTCAYTDEGNTARTLQLTFSQLAGTFITSITNVTGAGPYEGIPLHIRCKASTAITIATAGASFATVVYNVEGIIQQVA